MCYSFIRSGLLNKDSCLYVTRLSVSEVLRDCRAYGVDERMLEGSIFWIASEEGQEKYTPGDLSTLSFRIKEFLKRNRNRKTRIVMDVLSSLLMLNSAEVVYRFMDQLFSEIKLFDAVLLATVEEGMHPSQSLVAMEQLFDGTIKARPSGDSGVSLQISKMRSIPGVVDSTITILPTEKSNLGKSHDVIQADGWSRRKIAVLPFTNISPDPADAYFADGVTEELISTISKIAQFQVIARTSVMRYKDEKKSANEIGRELKVGCLLEGGVRIAGQKLRITVQLIDSQTSGHIWSDAYDRELKDVFAIQSDVAQRVAEALQVQLIDSERERIEKEPTNSQVAHSLYLKGLQHEHEFSEEGFAKALQYFNLAVSDDSNYARPYTAIVEAYYFSAIFGYVRFSEVREKVQNAAHKAIELDKDSAETHVALSMLKMTELDFVGAEAESRRSVELDASCSEGIHHHAIHLLFLGRREEALAEARKRVELDPLSLEAKLDLGWMLYEAGRFDEGIGYIKKTIEADPYFHSSHMYLGCAYFAASRFDEAVSEFLEAVKLTGRKELRIIGYLGEAYARMGNEEEARKIIQVLERSSEARPVSDSIASVYLALGELDETFLWTERAVEENNPFFLGGLNVEREWDSVRSDPRFVALMKKIGAKVN